MIFLSHLCCSPTAVASVSPNNCAVVRLDIPRERQGIVFGVDDEERGRVARGKKPHQVVRRIEPGRL